MGKQKAHRRQAREAKEQARQQTGIEVLNVVKDQLPADPPAAVTSLALVPTPTPAPVGAKKEPTPTSVAAPAKRWLNLSHRYIVVPFGKSTGTISGAA